MAYVVISFRITELLSFFFFTAAVITPLTYTAYQGQPPVRFNCTTVNARNIVWCVDGVFQSDVLLDRGITTEGNSTARNKSSLTISSTDNNNNSSIQCLAFYDTVNHTSSNESTFYVQGELTDI